MKSGLVMDVSCVYNFDFGVAHHAGMAAFQGAYLFSPNYNYNGKLLKLIFSLSLLYY